MKIFFEIMLTEVLKICEKYLLDFVTQRKLSTCSGSVSQRQLNHGFCPSSMGTLNLEICQNFVGTKFFHRFVGG